MELSKCHARYARYLSSNTDLLSPFLRYTAHVKNQGYFALFFAFMSNSPTGGFKGLDLAMKRELPYLSITVAGGSGLTGL